MRLILTLWKAGSMRLWQDSKGAFITDEQVLRYIATFGSLSEALERGDIRLISDSGGLDAAEFGRLQGPPTDWRKRRLADYMQD